MKGSKKTMFRCDLCGTTEFENAAPEGDTRKLCLVCAIDLNNTTVGANDPTRLDVPLWAWGKKDAYATNEMDQEEGEAVAAEPPQRTDRVPKPGRNTPEARQKSG